MGRSPCCEKSHTNKGAWTKDEDHKLVDYIRRNGEGCWRSLPKSAGLLRCGKSCRLRWINYLRPDLKRGYFSDEEDELIIKLHGVLGNKWSLIAGRLAGRTDNEIKNYWNTHIKRKLISRGLDPQTHRPLNEPPSTAVKPAQLDFRSSASLPVAEINLMTGPSPVFTSGTKTPKWVESDSGEDANCSDMTTDEDHPPPQRPEEELNLELTIGMAGPSHAESTPASSAESKPQKKLAEFAGVAAEAVCLCCQLGFHGGEMCRNCESRNGYYRFCSATAGL